MRTNIPNCMLTAAEYPDNWKAAQVVPIPKCKRPTEFQHLVYQPIHYCSIWVSWPNGSVIIDKMRTLLTLMIQSQLSYTHSVGATQSILYYFEDKMWLVDRTDVKFMQSVFLNSSPAFDNLQASIFITPVILLEHGKLCVEFSNHFSGYQALDILDMVY